MPYAGTGDPIEAPSFNQGIEVPQDVQNQVSTAQYGRSFNPVQTAGYYAIGAVSDLVDTVASSVPGVNRALGAERGDFNRYVTRSLDLPGINQFFIQNKGGIEAASGVAGIIASELVARRVTAPAGVFMGALRATPFLRRIAVLDEQAAAALNTVRSVDVAVAQRGVMGAAQYDALASVRSPIFDAASGTMRESAFSITRNRAVFNAKALSAAVGVRDAAVTEALMATTLNQNGFLYDDSAGFNLAMGGLGLAGGGVLQSLHAAYQIRKFANSDLVRRAFAGALDPEQIEQGRLTWMGKPFTKEELQAGDYLGGVFTDRVTSYGVSASRLKELPPAGVDDPLTLIGQREALATQHLQLAHEELQKVTTKGISSDGRTRFTNETAGAGNHIDMVLHRDPAALYGSEQVGVVPDGLSAQVLVDQHLARVDTRLQQTESRIHELIGEIGAAGKDTPARRKELAFLQERTRRLTFEKSLTPLAIVDGELMPVGEAAAFEGFTEPKIIATRMADDQAKHGVMLETVSEAPGGAVTLDHNLSLTLPYGKTLHTADHFDMLRAYRLGEDMATRLARSADPILMTDKPTWFQLDLAERILQKNPNAHIMWPGGLSRESAQVESFVQKSIALKRMGDKLTPEQASKFRTRYNLPRLTAFERGQLGTDSSPIEFLLRGMTNYTPDQLRKFTLAELKDGVAQAKRLGDLTPVTRHDVKSLSGSSFTFMQDESGRAVRPLVTMKRPFQVADWSVDTVAERLASRQMKTLTTLAQATDAPLSKVLTESISGSEDFQLVARPDQLLDTQIQGSLLGAAPQSALGAIPKEFVTTEHMARDNPILLAAVRLNDMVDRIVRDEMKRVIETAFGDNLKLLANPRNASSKLLLDQFHTYRSGWDLDTKLVDRGDGFFGFKLGDTEGNRARWAATYQGEWRPGDLLRGPDGKVVVLDSMGKQLQESFNAVTTQLLKEKNALLRSMGRSEIKIQNHFVPAPDVQGKYIGFVMGPDNKIVPGYTAVADTADGFAKERARIHLEMDKLPNNGIGFVFRTQDQIKQFANVWDRAEMDMINPGTTAIQPNKRGTGKLVGPSVRLDAFQDSMTYLRNQYIQHGGDIREALLREQIKSAEARAVIAKETSRNASGEAAKGRSIYDYYLQAIRGSSKLNHPGSYVGSVFNPIERGLNRVFEASTPHAARAWNGFTDFMGRHRIWDKSAQGRKDFDALAEHLGEYMPFKSAVDLMERREAGATPVTLAKLAGGLNKVSAALMLRLFETAHPIMNLTGILNSAPAVVRQFTPRVGESIEDFGARIGHSANIFSTPDGPIATLDIIKVANRALRNAWSRGSHADFDFMVRRGYLSQEVAEFHRQFGAIESRGKASEFTEKLVNKLSVLSDKSEDFSRSWGHMIGLEVADLLSITGRDTRHAFAHDVANKMIANYNPANRPDIFQGALGAPIGLFQSFVQNYYQRLFRYVETKDVRALGTQYAVQSALFGVTGLAGWSQAASLVDWLSHGEKNPTTGIHGNFTGNAGDLLAHGLISSLPKIFGGDGVDLYSRGDTNARIPGVGTQQLPGMAVLSKVGDAIGAGITLFKSGMEGTLTPTQTAELASNLVINRPLSGAIEQVFAGGNDTDGAGQLVNDTRSWSEAVYRLMGLRSERQSKAVAAYYADKQAMEHKAAADERLRESSRAAIRGGRVDKLPAIFETYVTNGGDPRRFRPWLKETYQSAHGTRAERQLDKLMNGSHPDMNRVMRFLDMGVGVDEDEAMGDVADKYGYGPDELDQPTYQPGVYANQTTVEPAAPIAQ